MKTTANNGADGKWIAVDGNGRKLTKPHDTQQEALAEANKLGHVAEGAGSAGSDVKAKQILNG